MSIIYSAVAIEKQVLAQCASCVGNFTEVTAEILSKVPPHNDKITYTSGKYNFHYIAENKLVYFCITDDKCPRSKAFSFLEQVQKKFLESFGDVPLAAIPFAVMKHGVNGDFSRVMDEEMKIYNDSKAKLTKVKAELEEVKSIVASNVARAAERGAQLENLITRTEGLAEQSHSYRVTTVRVKRVYWWQNIKMYIILVVVLIVAVYFIGASACGGLTWRNCVG